MDRRHTSFNAAIALSLAAHVTIILILSMRVSMDTASAAVTTRPEPFVLSVEMYNDSPVSHVDTPETVDVEQAQAIAPKTLPQQASQPTQAQPKKTSQPTHAQPKQRSSAEITPPVTTLPITQANYLNNPRPAYPRQSRRLGEQGTVLLAVQIDTDGTAAEVRVNHSSGYTRLDQLALTTVRAWRFVPGKKAGVPQKMWVNIPIDFILE